jgi:phenylalanyl-tRNA synthetase beta chain
MRVSRRWLSEFVDLPELTAAELAGVMTGIGLEVESVDEVDVAFNDRVIVARVLEVDRHPNADKLRVARLDTGSGPHEVVCGAWNFEAGAVVPLALPGTVLAGGLEVGEREIRGVSSPGMICSEAELGIGEEAGGILVLADDHAPLGTPFGGTLPYPDVIYDLAITPNRPDAMSVFGVARDLAAFFDLPLRTPEVELRVAGPDTGATVTVRDPDLCPRFTAREIRDVRLAPSPLWMRLRLRDAGVRPISNVVDITNYVMLELGQPLHAFDLDRIPDETLVIRRAEPGERLTTLDSVDRALDPDDLLVAGPTEGLALAGVMGGEDSEVADDTSRILLEVAHFSASGVLLTGKRHGLRTEAVARFERGVDPALPPRASDRAAALMAELAGGTVCGGFVDVYPEPIEPWTVTLPGGEVSRLLGTDIPADEIAAILRRLGFAVEGDDPFVVDVPTFRPDVTRPADLVEEVARLFGYDNIPVRVPHGPGGGLPPEELGRRAVRNAMVGAGYHEMLSYSFLGSRDIEAMRFPSDDRRSSPVAVRNPLNEEEGVLRTSLLPGLLKALRHNQSRNNEDVGLFEIGKVFLASEGPIPDQPDRLAFAAVGALPGPVWEGRRRERDAHDAVGVWETLAAALGISYRILQSVEPAFHTGRAGRIAVGDEVIGVVGEIHPAVAAGFEVIGRVAAGELDLGRLVEPAGRRTFRAPSSFPPVVFDLAFDVDDEVAAADLIGVVQNAGGPALERVVLFDVFVGPPLAEGRKSLAVRLTVRDPERTLSDDDVAPVREAIAAAVWEGLGGRLRGG